jgi:hypothetical protein
MRMKAIFEPSDEGGYTVYVPSLPGCVSEGESLSVDDVTPLEGGLVGEITV